MNQNEADQTHIPPCCLKAQAYSPDAELEGNCHATVVSGWFSGNQTSAGHSLYLINFFAHYVYLYQYLHVLKKLI